MRLLSEVAERSKMPKFEVCLQKTVFLGHDMPPKHERGFTLIELLIVVTIIGIIGAIAVPGLLRARISGNEVSAIGSLRAINSAQATYAASCGGGFYSPTLLNLGTPPPGSADGFIGPDLGSVAQPVKSGYSITLSAVTVASGSSASCNGLPAGSLLSEYFVQADPTPGAGVRHFATTQGGTIRSGTSQLANGGAGTPIQ